ncbi:uncharacterized protein [Diadema antillarum]|uniref:uncharacterized protein n=1 Tax=Diadema antillarum TaxID=105358 RepID=UPI003A8423B3
MRWQDAALVALTTADSETTTRRTSQRVPGRPSQPSDASPMAVLSASFTSCIAADRCKSASATWIHMTLLRGSSSPWKTRSPSRATPAASTARSRPSPSPSSPGSRARTKSPLASSTRCSTTTGNTPWSSRTSNSTMSARTRARLSTRMGRRPPQPGLTLNCWMRKNWTKEESAAALTSRGKRSHSESEPRSCEPPRPCLPAATRHPSSSDHWKTRSAASNSSCLYHSKLPTSPACRSRR